jgi:hypothetical protein
MNHIEAMKLMVVELEYVLDCINNEEMPFDGDDFHEALRLGRQAIAEAEKQVSYSGNGTAGRENMTAPTGFFFQMPKAEKQDLVGEMQLSAIVEGLVVPVVSVELPVGTKLYTHPQPKREPLTGEEIRRLWEEAAKPERSTMTMITSFVASVEAVHGIKGEA